MRMVNFAAAVCTQGTGVPGVVDERRALVAFPVLSHRFS